MLTREPIVVRGAIVAAITGILHALVVMGALPIDPQSEAAIAGAIDLVGTAVLVAWTRGKVTPVAAPKGIEIPAGTGTRRDVDLPEIEVTDEIVVEVETIS